MFENATATAVGCMVSYVLVPVYEVQSVILTCHVKKSTSTSRQLRQEQHVRAVPQHDLGSLI